MGLQQAMVRDIYFRYIYDLKKEFQINGHQIIIYVMKIHPRHWLVLGNLYELEDNLWMTIYKNKLKYFIMIENNLNECEAEVAIKSFTFYGN